MDEGTMAAVLGLSVACVALLAWLIERQGMKLERMLQAEVQKIEMEAFPSIDELRDEVADLIADTMGQMRTPQIADHLGAILQQWAQIKFAREMQSMNALGLVPSSDTPAEPHLDD